MNFKLGIYCIARERWWLCETVPDVWPWYHKAGADLGRAVKTSCSTVPEMQERRTQWPGDLFQPCVIFALFFAGLGGSSQRMRYKRQVRRLQYTPGFTSAVVSITLSQIFFLIASNSVTSRFDSSFKSNFKWTREMIQWSVTAVKCQQCISYILTPGLIRQQRTRNRS